MAKQGADREEGEAIVMNASGSGVTGREYGQMLKDDPVDAVKAKGSRHAGLERSCPISRTLKGRVNAPRGVVAYHPPCTLQRGQNCAAASKWTCALRFDVQVGQIESISAAAPGRTPPCICHWPSRCATAS